VKVNLENEHHMPKHITVNQEVILHRKTVSGLGFQNVFGRPEERSKQLTKVM